MQDFDISVNDCPYDKDDAIRYLETIEELIDQLGADEVEKVLFNHCKTEILNTVDYLLHRLQHSEKERFQ